MSKKAFIYSRIYYCLKPLFFKITLVFFLLFYCLNLHSQDSNTLSETSNPIIYISTSLGTSIGNKGYGGGFLFTTSVNYQMSKNLFLYRFSHNAEFNKNPGIAALLIVPIFLGDNIMNEHALMYGRRFVFNNSSVSTSVGFGLSNRNYTEFYDNNSKFITESYVSIPFEINFRLFQSRKKKFRILYGLIPVTRPTGFARSFGLKLYGSLGKFNYFGVGLNFGLGWHKKY